MCFVVVGGITILWLLIACNVAPYVSDSPLFQLSPATRFYCNKQHCQVCGCVYPLVLLFAGIRERSWGAFDLFQYISSITNSNNVIPWEVFCVRLLISTCFSRIWIPALPLAIDWNWNISIRTCAQERYFNMYDGNRLWAYDNCGVTWVSCGTGQVGNKWWFQACNGVKRNSEEGDSSAGHLLGLPPGSQRSLVSSFLSFC